MKQITSAVKLLGKNKAWDLPRNDGSKWPRGKREGEKTVLVVCFRHCGAASFMFDGKL